MENPLLQSAGGTVLPAALAAFLRRRLFELSGVALLTVTAALAVALASYHTGDPSLNSATGRLPQNLLGLPGAYIADLGLQTVGLAAAVPVLVFAAWGWRLLRKLSVSLIAVRFLLMLAALFLLGMALGHVPPPAEWSLNTGPGGAAGALMLTRAADTLHALGAPYGVWIAAGLAATVGMLALITAIGLTWAEWQAIGNALKTSVLAAGRVAAAGAGLARRAVVRPAADSGGRIEPALDEDGDIDTHIKVSPEAPANPRRKSVRKTAKSLVAAKAPKPKTGRRAQAQRQGKLDLGEAAAYELPPLDLLELPPDAGKNPSLNKDALQQNAQLLATVLEDFGVRGEIIKVRPGPVITMYELEPAPGTKTSRVIGLSDDIARSMSAVSVRVAVVPGRNVIGIELPNLNRETVYLRELLASETFEKNSGKLTLVLGKDIGGQPMVVDLARMPHLLIAGTTGSGKSVAINTMILSLLYQMTPDQCKFIMIDPKMLELSVYDNIPHLLTPVVTEPGKAVVALKWAVREMEERYRAMSQLGVRNIAGYNSRLAEANKKGEELTRRVQTGFDDAGKPVFEDQPLSMEPLPLIVVVVDEMADLMLVAGKDIEAAVQRLAQMARAAGIHLIMATQRPSVDVITGTIKANFPTRISFQVTSKIDSRTILGEQGAEQLLGQGDMLFMAGGGRITRVHGPFVSDEEVEDVVSHLKLQSLPDYLEAVTEEDDSVSFPGMPGGGNGDSGDALYDEAIAVIAREGKASTSFIQRHLQIGYNRAARIIERMEAEGVVSKANRVGKREILIPTGSDHAA